MNEFDEIVEALSTIEVETLLKKSKFARIIEEVTGEPRVTLIKELKEANIKKGDRVITAVIDDGIIVVMKLY